MVFGYDTKGTSYSYYSSFALGSKYQADQTGNIEKIKVYVTCTAARNVKVAIWRDSDKVLIGQGVANTGGALDGWLEVTLDSPVAVTSGIDYWLGARADDTCTAWYDDGAANQAFYKSITYADFPSNPLGGVGNNDRKYSIYATYEEGGIAYYQTITEKMGMTDSVPAPVGAFKIAVPTEKLGMLDSIPAPVGAFKIALPTEKLGMLDSATRSKIVPVTITDILGMKDKLEKRKRQIKRPDLPDYTKEGGAPT
jgi:hypothetical protein